MEKSFLRRFIGRIKIFAATHKIWSGIIVIAAIFVLYWSYGKLTGTSGETRYVLSSVEKGTVVASVSGTGQVAVSNQVDLKPKVSGNIVYIGATDGQTVSAGTLIAEIDATDAMKTVRDAQINLDSANLSLQKLQQPADALSVTQSQNTLDRAKEAKQNAQSDLARAYDDSFNTVSNAFLDLPGIMTGLHDILYLNSTGASGGGQWNLDYYAGVAGQLSDSAQIQANQYRDDANAKYNLAKSAYDANFGDYKAANRSSATSTVNSLTSETYDTVKDIAEAIKSANNLIQFYEDTVIQRGLRPISLADTQLASLNTYTGKTNTELVNLLTANNTIKTGKDAITNADRTIDENTQSLAKLKAGADPLDVKSSQLSVEQRQNALQDAKDNLDNYYIRAPFDGVVAKINVKKGAAVAASDIISTFITKNQLAQLSLNEVDAAKVKVGQLATLTFDAVDGLSIAGKVSDVDTVGTVTQGVVTYAVQIAFDSQDSRVKPGMSVSAAIVTDVHQDVLTAPNSAIKTQNGSYYVDTLTGVSPTASEANAGVPSSAAPVRQSVQTGLSNDILTEITGGLKEGDYVVTKTVTATAASTASAPSLLNAVSGNRAGAGGAARFGGGAIRGN